MPLLGSSAEWHWNQGTIVAGRARVSNTKKAFSFHFSAVINCSNASLILYTEWIGGNLGYWDFKMQKKFRKKILYISGHRDTDKYKPLSRAKNMFAKKLKQKISSIIILQIICSFASWNLRKQDVLRIGWRWVIPQSSLKDQTPIWGTKHVQVFFLV